MLFRVVRPMKRDGSRFPIFAQRIPADVKAKAVGLRAQSVRFSLRTTEPSKIKTRQAVAAAYLEGVWSALREDAPIKRLR